MANITSDLIGQREQRLENVRKLREIGVDPYPASSKKDYANKYVKDHFDSFKGKEVTLAGRMVGKREHGKLIFADLNDQSGTIQVALKENEVSEDLKNSYLGWHHLKLLDLGDFIQVTGKVEKTEQGEITLFTKYIRVLVKSIRPLPDRIEDKEQKFRRRYLDFAVNTDVRDIFVRKSKFWQKAREFMVSRGFIEVETPILELVTGGADAKPFATHHNALDQDFYLRISSELAQKRLIGGGFEKVFVLGPNFRNEGIDDEHLQEFYQLEYYWAYSDIEDTIALTKDLYKHLAKEVWGKTKFTRNGMTFDLGGEWDVIDYVKIIKERFDVNVFETSLEKIYEIIKKNGVEIEYDQNRNRLVDNLWKIIRKDIAGPAALINAPKFISPLAKSYFDNQQITQRFQPIIAGSEVGNAYSELNDPIDQLDRFLDQQNLRDSGDDEAQMLDIDFVEMLEYGMPPTSCIGFSERLFWFLEGVTAREGTLFPQMRIEHDEITRKIYKGKVNFNEKTQFPDLNDEGLFSIGKSAKEKWPTINVGFAIIKGINVAKTNPELEELKKELYPQFETLTNETISAYPEILSYRKMYKEMGIDWHSRRPSPEALLRRLAKGKGLYTVNTVVDAYNIVVMKNRVSSGAFDLDKISFPTVLRLAEKGEKIHLLGDEAPTDYSEAEIAYFDQNGGFNIDFNYRDAQRTAVQLDTKNIMINIDGVYDITREQVEKTLKETIEMITRFCGGKVEIAGIVSALKNEPNKNTQSVKSSLPSTPIDLSGLPTREEALKLLEEHVKEPYQRLHARMVAQAMEACATKFSGNEELWYITGLLHDLDYDKFPDTHPNVSVKWFADWGYPEQLIHAVAAHAHSSGRTETIPNSQLDFALIACDELSGLIYAYSLMRPTGYDGMEAKSVMKKFKDKAFAAKIDREEILSGTTGLNVDIKEHIAGLILVFSKMDIKA